MGGDGDTVSGLVVGLRGALLVTMDIRGWIFLELIWLVLWVWVLAWGLGSLGLVGGTIGDSWGPMGAGEGGE